MTMNKTILSLSGQWKVKLIHNHGDSIGQPEEAAAIPGTLEENKIGHQNTQSSSGGLMRTYIYDGVAVYERAVNIPEEWAGKKIRLFLERTRIASVYVDGQFYGSDNTLSTSQVFDVSEAMTPGEHIISIEVDNASEIMSWSTVKNSHAASNSTQTNWNGILGRIELQCLDSVFMEDVKVFPDIVNKAVKISVLLEKWLDKEAKGKIRVGAKSFNSDKSYSVQPEIYDIHLESAENSKRFEFIYNLGDEVQLWDEFNPALYQLTLQLHTTINGEEATQEKTVDFGMRIFGTRGSQFTINDRVTFLRGKHDACLFPLTAYAPMDVESWVKIFKIAKAYGINHYRFHSCCPPDAAFTAADLTGIYMQPELPIWSGTAFQNEEEWAYYQREALKIIHEFGNHPSFVMFAWGNELAGSMERMLELIGLSKDLDPRRLYSHGSNNFLSSIFIPEGVDYWCTMWTEGQWDFRKPGYGGKWVRGSFAHHTRGHINNEQPSTLHNYSESIEGVPMPIIGHEVGQYQVHPNFKGLDKYTGVLKPRNFEIFRENLKNKGLLHQVEAFFEASGALAVLCYREEIEAALRTEGFGGFQLLDLQDFPGQGTALVGILDSFMESKGLIEPQNWRAFCSETVPLLKMSKYVWTSDEVFAAEIAVANYGPKDIKRPVSWRMSNQLGESLACGRLDSQLVQGEVTEVGRIELDLGSISEAQKLTVYIEIEGTAYRNEYSLWVYPANVDREGAGDVKICTDSSEAVQYAEQGFKVLLMPREADMNNSVEGAFIPDFWCYSMFKKYSPPGTLGILCNPEHPALNEFPTESHSNWQWWNIAKQAKPIILDRIAEEVEPLVQVIDNIHRQHKLGLIIEGRLGAGQIVICASNLAELQDKPEAKQLLHSLLSYMQSEQFNPSWACTKEDIRLLLGDDIATENNPQMNPDDVTDFYG